MSQLVQNLSNKIDKHKVIEGAVKLDYPKTKKGVKTASLFIKALKSFLPALDVLEMAANEYKESQLSIAEKDHIYIKTVKNNLDVPFLIQTLTPIANSIPGGDLILTLLKEVAKPESTENTDITTTCSE